MSILDKAAPSRPEPLIVTICGTPGSGKSSLAAMFPKPFLIRTQGEGVPRDSEVQPNELGEVTSSERLWPQLMALAKDEHDYKTCIIDTVTGLNMLFTKEIVDNDPKANSINQAGGGYGAGRNMLAADHMRLRRAAEMLRKRGMHVVFLAHSDIVRVEPPDSEGYTAWTLRMDDKAIAPYVDNVDLVGFIKQNTVLVGDDRKRAITDDERILVVTMTPSAVAKNRLGITEDLVFVRGENPLEPWLEPKSKRGRPAKAKTEAVVEADDEVDPNDAVEEGAE